MIKNKRVTVFRVLSLKCNQVIFMVILIKFGERIAAAIPKFNDNFINSDGMDLETIKSNLIIKHNCKLLP